MSRRGRILLSLALVLFAALSFSTSPYWQAAIRSSESDKGRSARAQVANDTPNDFIARAVIGGGIALILCGFQLLPASKSRKPM